MGTFLKSPCSSLSFHSTRGLMHGTDVSPLLSARRKSKPEPNASLLISAIMVNLLLLVSCVGRGPAQNEILLHDPVVTTTDAGAVRDYREKLISEPVFSGSVRILEAGKRTGLSIVLVHGMGDRGARDWEQVLPVFAEQYHVVAFDLPGFGSSSKTDTLYSPDRDSSFLKLVVGQYVKGPYVLMGHSLGGALALKYASQYPENLEYLILS